MVDQPAPHDVVLGGHQKQKIEYSLRDDVEAVLRHLEQEDRRTDNELVRVKLNHEQRMIALLMEKGSKKMLVPLIQWIDALEVMQRQREEQLQQECDQLFKENRALKAKLAAVHYELSGEKEIDRDRLLSLLDTEFGDEFRDLLGILWQSGTIANWYRTGRRISAPRVRHLATLIEEFQSKYPHFSRSRVYREVRGESLYDSSLEDD